MANNFYNRERLLRRLQAVCFCVEDVILYLDTHPTDMNAIEYYKRHKEMLQEVTAEYTRMYGPITASDVCVSNKWSWINCPWPWEMEA